MWHDDNNTLIYMRQAIVWWRYLTMWLCCGCFGVQKFAENILFCIKFFYSRRANGINATIGTNEMGNLCD